MMMAAAAGGGWEGEGRYQGWWWWLGLVHQLDVERHEPLELGDEALVAEDSACFYERVCVCKCVCVFVMAHAALLSLTEVHQEGAALHEAQQLLCMCLCVCAGFHSKMSDCARARYKHTHTHRERERPTHTHLVGGHDRVGSERVVLEKVDQAAVGELRKHISYRQIDR